MSDNKDKLKKMYAALPADRKEKLKRSISDRFKITIDSVKNNWIYGGKIPDEHFNNVFKMVKKEAETFANIILELTS
ncbi:hypothetical protein [uncultured Chryseobacterium sp.]|uniref:hypothetical protein n=1 Tax=uncultured Chryseobacterium sp. TaxID=259322 RepID=UPI0025FA8CBC|nr:hypothetical protein [uncultured Chryseobacterium sp.]